MLTDRKIRKPVAKKSSKEKKKLKYSWDSGESKEEMGVWSKRSTNPFFINV